jgi:hypothetical protein
LKARIPRLTYSNVIATLALFLALGGGALAASNLGKNTVGSKQLKKNAVTTAKIKNKAVTGAKIKPGTITGTQVNASTLGTVPVANLANSLAPPEAVHLVGGAGQPGFLNKWQNPPGGPPGFNPVGFYKDHEGVVHLQGLAVGGEENKALFQLPPGFRPGPGKVVAEPALCTGLPCAGNPSQPVLIFGSNISLPAGEGAVVMAKATGVDLDGVTFRAES